MLFCCCCCCCCCCSRCVIVRMLSFFGGILQASLFLGSCSTLNCDFVNYARPIVKRAKFLLNHTNLSLEKMFPIPMRSHYLPTSYTKTRGRIIKLPVEVLLIYINSSIECQRIDYSVSQSKKHKLILCNEKNICHEHINR